LYTAGMLGGDRLESGPEVAVLADDKITRV
jgi:hypothetical protein